MDNKNTLENKKKVAIVTGSSSGIGYEIAFHLAKNGFYTYATMRNLSKADGVTKIAERESAIACNNYGCYRQCIYCKSYQYYIYESRRIDVLVNNAGYGLIGSVEDTSIEEIKAQYETNIFRVFRVTKEVIPYMREQHGGFIINISSIAGLIALPMYSAYVSTKLP